MPVTLIHVWLWLTKTATCQQLTAMRRRLRRRTEGPSAEGSSQARWQCTRLTPRPDSWGWVAHTLPGSRPHQCRRYSRNALCLTARIIQQKHNMTELHNLRPNCTYKSFFVAIFVGGIAGSITSLWFNFMNIEKHVVQYIKSTGCYFALKLLCC